MSSAAASAPTGPANDNDMFAFFDFDAFCGDGDGDGQGEGGLNSLSATEAATYASDGSASPSSVITPEITTFAASSSTIGDNHSSTPPGSVTGDLPQENPTDLPVEQGKDDGGDGARTSNCAATAEQLGLEDNSAEPSSKSDTSSTSTASESKDEATHAEGTASENSTGALSEPLAAAIPSAATSDVDSVSDVAVPSDVHAPTTAAADDDSDDQSSPPSNPVPDAGLASSENEEPKADIQTNVAVTSPTTSSTSATAEHPHISRSAMKRRVRDEDDVAPQVDKRVRTVDENDRPIHLHSAEADKDGSSHVGDSRARVILQPNNHWAYTAYPTSVNDLPTSTLIPSPNVTQYGSMAHQFVPQGYMPYGASSNWVTQPVGLQRPSHPVPNNASNNANSTRGANVGSSSSLPQHLPVIPRVDDNAAEQAVSSVPSPPPLASPPVNSHMAPPAPRTYVLKAPEHINTPDDLENPVKQLAIEADRKNHLRSRDTDTLTCLWQSADMEHPCHVEVSGGDAWKVHAKTAHGITGAHCISGARCCWYGCPNPDIKSSVQRHVIEKHARRQRGH